MKPLTQAQRKKLLSRVERNCDAITEIASTLRDRSNSRRCAAFSFTDDDLLILFKFTHSFLPAIVNISRAFTLDKKAMKSAERAWKRGLKLSAKYEAEK